MGFSDGNGGPDVDWKTDVSLLVKHICVQGRTVFILDSVLEDPGGKVTPRVHSNNLLFVTPLRERADAGGGFCVGEVGPRDSRSAEYSGFNSEALHQPML